MSDIFSEEKTVNYLIFAALGVGILMFLATYFWGMGVVIPSPPAQVLMPVKIDFDFLERISAMELAPPEEITSPSEFGRQLPFSLPSIPATSTTSTAATSTAATSTVATSTAATSTAP